MQPNKTNLTTAAIFALVFMLIGGVIGWKIKPCPTCIGTVTVSVTDSTAPAKDTGIIAINTQPKLKETRKYSPDASHKNGTLSGDSRNYKVVEFDHLKDNTPNSGELKGVESDTFTNYSLCLDTNIFVVDTQAVDSFKIKATATVTNNQLIGLNFEYQNFKPEKWKVINTKTTVEKKQALVKVFPELYARANFNAVTATGGGAGGGASFVVNDRHLVGVDAGVNKSLGQPISGEVMLRYGFKLQLKK